MGGAVSSGRDNNELIDNLMGGNYIRTRSVERVFRALDRAEYMTPEARDQAYKDLAWRNGPLHLSAPCIYSEVMEGLELHPGLSFLNVGSGTGYLSTLVGLIIGSGGISHGIEIQPMVVEYANKKLGQFIENSATLDEFDFCEPKYYCGNGLRLAPLQSPYDRVYCGAGCPEQYQNYFKQLVKVGGVLVMPLNDSLVQVRRVADAEWTSRALLSVSFAALRVPARDDTADLIKLEEQCPARLQILSRAVVRSAMRGGLVRRHPELREPPHEPAPAKKRCPRRICIPIEDDSDVEGLDSLHDLDPTTGGTEMNALLSLVLSMGQNRVAGALRFDSLDSPTDSDSDDDDNDETPPNGEAEPTLPSASAGVDALVGNAPRVDDADASVDGDDKTNEDDSLAGRTAGGAAGVASGSVTGGVVSGAAGSVAGGTAGGAAGGAAGGVVGGAAGGTAGGAIGGAAGGAASGGAADSAKAPVNNPGDNTEPKTSRPCRGLLTLEFHEDGAGSSKTKSRPSANTTSTSNDSGADSDGGSGDLGGVPAEVEIYLGKEVAGTSREAVMEWHDEVQEQEDDTILEDSTDEDSSEQTSKELKRQKLDSGIGEGTSPSSGGSPRPRAPRAPRAPRVPRGPRAPRPRPPAAAAARPRRSAPASGQLHASLAMFQERLAPVIDEGRQIADSIANNDQVRGRRRLLRRHRGTRQSSSSTEYSDNTGADTEAEAEAEAGADAEAGAEAEADADAEAGSSCERACVKRRATPHSDARRVRLSIVMKRGVKELPLPYALKKYVNLGRCFEF